MKQAKEVNASSGGCPSAGSGRTDIDGESGLCSEIKATHVRRSREDMFGEFQGKLVFLDELDAPTIDEWPEM